MAIRTCPSCLVRTNLQDNGNCRPCNLKQDLIRCRRCKDYLPPVSFIWNRTVCDGCTKGIGRGRPRTVHLTQLNFALAMLKDGMPLSAAARVVRVQRDTLRRALRRAAGTG